MGADCTLNEIVDGVVRHMQETVGIGSLRAFGVSGCGSRFRVERRSYCFKHRAKAGNGIGERGRRGVMRRGRGSRGARHVKVVGENEGECLRGT